MVSDTYGFPGSGESFLRPVIERAGQVLAIQREQLILYVPVVMGCGNGLYFSLAAEPPAFIGWGCLVFVTALWGLFFPLRFKDGAGYAAWLVFGFLTAFCTGYCAAEWRTMHVQAPVLERNLRAAEVQGRVIGLDRLEDGEGYRLILDRLAIDRLPADATPRKVRIKVRQHGDQQPAVGDTVKIFAGLNPPAPPAAPGAFDFQRYSYFQQIGAYGFSYHAPEIIRHDDAAALTQRLEALRESVARRIERAVGYPEAAIAIALMTGERSGIAEGDWQAFRDSGLAHMLAISGLHIGLIAGTVFAGCRILLALVPWIALRFPIKKIAAIAALMGAVGYTLLAGATIPTIRALLMTAVVLFALLIDRVPFSLRLVAVAASAVLMVMPEALQGASFQMSFAAVTALIFCYQYLKPYLSSWHRDAGVFRKVLIYFAGVCFTTVVATVATAPFSVFHFQQLPVYSLLANFFAMPLMAFVVMPAALLSLALMPLGWEGSALKLMGGGIHGILSIAHDVQAMPLSAWIVPSMPAQALLWFVLASLFFILWRGRGKVLALLPLLIAVLCIWFYRPPDILVSSSGKLAALRDAQGLLWLSSRRTDRFTAEGWAKSYGLGPDDVSIFSENPAFSCGEDGCRIDKQGHKVAFSFHPAGQAEDCAWADVLVSFEPLRAKDCRAAVQVGFFDLRRNGAYAIWLDGKVLSVRDARGQRPWTGVNYR